MHAFISLWVDRTHQVLVHGLGGKGRDRRQQAGEFYQHMIQRGIGLVFIGIVFPGGRGALPEAAPAAAHVPVAQIVQEGGDRQRGAQRIGILQRLRHQRHDLVQARQHPAVEHVPTLRRRPLRVSRIEALTPRPPFPTWGEGKPPIQVGVGGEEAVDIPQRDQELAAGLVAAMITEEQVVFGLVGAVQPAHHIHAHIVGGFVELDRVAPTLVHGAPVFCHQRGVTEILQEGRAARHHGAHRQQAVEPVAELPGERFADPVRRVPASPEIGVFAVAQCAEGHNAGVQPGIAHIRHAAHHAPALRAGQLDRIHIRPVRRMSFQRFPARYGPRF